MGSPSISNPPKIPQKSQRQRVKQPLHHLCFGELTDPIRNWFINMHRNYGMLWLGRDLLDHLIPTPWLGFEMETFILIKKNFPFPSAGSVAERGDKD